MGRSSFWTRAVQAYEESLKLTQDQANSGMASGQDVELAAALLDTTRAQATDLGIQRALLEHAIATLLGRPASTFAIASRALDLKPVPVPVGVPSQLLERRPDIAAAERRVAEANARIGVARTAYFPTTLLGASVGYQGASLGNLVSGSSLLWSLGASLAARPSLTAGSARPSPNRPGRPTRAPSPDYRQTVLGAFQDVEDNLSTLRILDMELRQQEAAVASSRRYLAFAVSRYQSGLDIYLDVITAQTSLLGNQRTAMGLLMQQMTANVQLVKALGGGWKDQPPPDPRR
jgi:NodT family efflux transporter outer membrane factor (OMF) lipoprotein